MFLMQMMLLFWMEPESGTCDRDRTQTKRSKRCVCCRDWECKSWCRVSAVKVQEHRDKDIEIDVMSIFITQ